MKTSRAQQAINAAKSPEQLAQDAITSNDGIQIAELLRTIEGTSHSNESKSAAVAAIARAHPEKSHIVVGAISSLQRLNAPELRPLCRTIVNAPFNPDRDLIISHAAATLCSIPGPETVDIQLITRAIQHRCEQIQTATRRAIKGLPHAIAEQYLALVDTLPSAPALEMLKRLLKERNTLSQLRLPPVPTVDVRSPRETKEAPTSIARETPKPSPQPPKRPASKRTFSTPVPEAQPIERESPPSSAASAESAPEETVESREPPATKPDAQHLLTPHRIPGYHLHTNSLLSNIIITSKSYREVAAALAEFTIRNGRAAATQFGDRIIYALSDPDNPEKVRFEDIANLLYT